MPLPQPLDRPLLAKVLALCASDSDGEALAAARRATSMVHSSGVTWDDVLLGGVPEGRQPAYVPDQAIRGFGSTLTPPYGTTWRQTVHRLIDLGAALPYRDLHLLDQVAVRLRRQPPEAPPRIGLMDAQDIHRMYAQVMAATDASR